MEYITLNHYLSVSSAQGSKFHEGHFEKGMGKLSENHQWKASDRKFAKISNFMQQHFFQSHTAYIPYR